MIIDNIYEEYVNFIYEDIYNEYLDKIKFDSSGKYCNIVEGKSGNYPQPYSMKEFIEIITNDKHFFNDLFVK